MRTNEETRRQPANQPTSTRPQHRRRLTFNVGPRVGISVGRSDGLSVGMSVGDTLGAIAETTQEEVSKKKTGASGWARTLTWSSNVDGWG